MDILWHGNGKGCVLNLVFSAIMRRICPKGIGVRLRSNPRSMRWTKGRSCCSSMEPSSNLSEFCFQRTRLDTNMFVQIVLEDFLARRWGAWTSRLLDQPLRHLPAPSWDQGTSPGHVLLGRCALISRGEVRGSDHSEQENCPWQRGRYRTDDSKRRCGHLLIFMLLDSPRGDAIMGSDSRVGNY